MLVVVGGHSRNIGKTSVVASIIRAVPEANWTAIKITQHGHGICSAAGEPCGCQVELDHPFALSQEDAPGPSDSGRFLAAGAARSYWLRTPVGKLGAALPALRNILDSSENAIVESNSLLHFVQPELYLLVLDCSVTDLKDSARRFFDRADALVIVRNGDLPWPVPARWKRDIPSIPAPPPGFSSPELIALVRRRLSLRQETRPGR
jgi:hypothetical protein